MKKPKSLWVSRDIGSEWVDLWVKKPEKDEYGDFILSDKFYLINYCYKYWLKYTNFKLKPGECKKVRINVEEIK